MPKISVIVPVYNTEKYLARCLQSLCSQCLQDIEILCVNDGSTDNSLAVLQHYASQDSRIHILSHAENSGESAARNTGMDAAQGQYIGFVDSDDWIDTNFYETLYHMADTQGSDITKGHLLYVLNDQPVAPSSINAEIEKFQSKHLFYHDFYTAIYKTSLIKENHLRFPTKVRIGPDIAFLSESIAHCNTLSLTNKTHYYYVQRADGALRSLRTVDEVNTLLQVRLKIMENILKSSLNYAPYFDHMLHMHMAAFYTTAFRTPVKELRLACAKAILILYTKALHTENLDALIRASNPLSLPVLKSNDPQALVAVFTQIIKSKLQTMNGAMS